ncbi:MAG: uroporphyrinogen-III synthase, partial [Nakamurella sp.]
AFTSAAAVDAVIAVGNTEYGDSPDVDGDRSSVDGHDSDADSGRRPSIIASTTHVAAVGHGTAAALAAAGCTVDLVPSGAQSGAALADSWPTEPAGRSVLLPCSDRARPELADGLRRSGHLVYPVVVYRTVLQPPPETLASELADGSISAVLLTSPSTCAALSSVWSGSARSGSARPDSARSDSARSGSARSGIGSAGSGDARISPRVVTIAIGPTTAAAAADAGISVTAVASEASDVGLVDALIRTIRKRAQEHINK